MKKVSIEFKATEKFINKHLKMILQELEEEESIEDLRCDLDYKRVDVKNLEFIDKE